ncbi:MAG: ArdC-like ssDNA-binding domain-containing protein [Phycisphaerales bacterium JB058]
MSARKRAGQEPGRPSRLRQTQELAESAIGSLSEQLAAGNRDRLELFLKAMGRFHGYSLQNLVLILAQKPDATRVAGFHAWKSLGRSVKKGEKGIAIIAPMRRRTKEPDGRSPAPSGNSGEGDETQSVLRFRVVHVFDLSQTEGEPLPELGRCGGDPGVYLGRLEEAVRARGITLAELGELGGADGVSRGGEILLAPGLSPAERFSVLAHEFAHELLHHTDETPRPPKKVRETEAEAVAYAVCSAIGLDTDTAAADYIRLYRGDAETLAASLDRIKLASCTIIDALGIGGDDREARGDAKTAPSKADPVRSYRVDPERLASGRWSHEQERTIGEGDIRASYSADRIGLNQPVRKPFTFRGARWVCVGTGGATTSWSAEAYRIVPSDHFDGEAITYHKKVRGDGGESARNDPLGFYHGIAVASAGRGCVLVGPPVLFVEGAAKQLSLFRERQR